MDMDTAQFPHEHFPENLAFNYIIERNDKLGNWDGLCGQLATNVSRWLKNQGIKHNVLIFKRCPEDTGGVKQKYLYPSTMPREWYYHVAIEVDGVIHDPWFKQPVPFESYLKVMFPSQVVEIKHKLTSGRRVNYITQRLMY